jgi:hypothetical protein
VYRARHRLVLKEKTPTGLHAAPPALLSFNTPCHSVLARALNDQHYRRICFGNCREHPGGHATRHSECLGLSRNYGERVMTFESGAKIPRVHLCNIKVFRKSQLSQRTLVTSLCVRSMLQSLRDWISSAIAVAPAEPEAPASAVSASAPLPASEPRRSARTAALPRRFRDDDDNMEAGSTATERAVIQDGLNEKQERNEYV